MPTQWGDFRLIPFKQKSNGLEHIALIKGDVADGQPVLVRVHSSCATGDIFGSMRCECGEQLHKAMELIEKEGRGVVVSSIRKVVALVLWRRSAPTSSRKRA